MARPRKVERVHRAQPRRDHASKATVDRVDDVEIEKRRRLLAAYDDQFAAINEAFFATPIETDPDELTPLQRRMRSGGF